MKWDSNLNFVPFLHILHKKAVTFLPESELPLMEKKNFFVQCHPTRSVLPGSTVLYSMLLSTTTRYRYLILSKERNGVNFFSFSSYRRLRVQVGNKKANLCCHRGQLVQVYLQTVSAQTVERAKIR
jgi:hypothetical protein